MKLTTTTQVSVDGVMQGCGGADEDRRGGFERGGWAMPLFDDEAMAFMDQIYRRADAFLFGRKTYDLFARYWGAKDPSEGAIAEALNTKPKYVASTTLTDPLEWENSTVLQGDVAEAVLALKQGEGADLLLIGSTQLAKTLIEHDLVDEYRLMIDPLVLGGGKRLFHDDRARRSLRLVDSQVVSTGAILATYVRGEAS